MSEVQVEEYIKNIFEFHGKKYTEKEIDLIMNELIKIHFAHFKKLYTDLQSFDRWICAKDIVDFAKKIIKEEIRNNTLNPLQIKQIAWEIEGIDLWDKNQPNHTEKYDDFTKRLEIRNGKYFLDGVELVKNLNTYEKKQTEEEVLKITGIENKDHPYLKKKNNLKLLG